MSDVITHYDIIYCHLVVSRVHCVTLCEVIESSVLTDCDLEYSQQVTAVSRSYCLSTCDCVSVNPLMLFLTVSCML